MGRYPDETTRRFDQQFARTPAETDKAKHIRSTVAGQQRRIGELNIELRNMTDRALLAERQVRELTLRVLREKSRAEAAEAQLKSLGHSPNPHEA